ncbi:ATP-grasp domain-containing protein [Agrobacterium cavarae]|uniref:ATP-grasp domain-containing protein n=1 Tax=Agrobacterium cavarae TaxID=2528239 RepID=UPI003FCFE41F
MNVLLIGSSFSAMPMLMALKDLGARVTAMGKHKDDPCHSYADASVYLDYSDKETLLEVCTEGKYDFVVPTCNDYSYLAGAYVADRLGFAGFDPLDVTEILHVKSRFRAFCDQAGISVPKTYGHFRAGENPVLFEFEGRALVKPVDSFSGRGVSLVDNAEDAVNAAAHAFTVSRANAAVVEEFVDGDLYSHTAFIADRKIVWHDFVDEFCEVYPYQVNRSFYPSRLPSDQRHLIHRTIEKLVAELGLSDGLLHTQLIASGDEFWIIECMRRCPGDLYGHQFKYSFGFNYEAAYIAGFIGREADLSRVDSTKVDVERNIISVDQSSPFFGARLRGGQREIIYVPLKDSGLPLEPAPFDKAAIVFFKGTGDAQVQRGGQAPALPTGYGIY